MGEKWGVSSKSESVFSFWFLASKHTFYVQKSQNMWGTVFEIPPIVQGLDISFPSFQDRRMGFGIGQQDIPTPESECEAGDTETQA